MDLAPDHCQSKSQFVAGGQFTSSGSFGDKQFPGVRAPVLHHAPEERGDTRNPSVTRLLRYRTKQRSPRYCHTEYDGKPAQLNERIRMVALADRLEGDI